MKYLLDPLPSADEHLFDPLLDSRPASELHLIQLFAVQLNEVGQSGP
jgi:hypothetical protein